MEIDKKEPVIYRLQATDDKVPIAVRKEVFERFLTLQNMMESLDEEISQVIPVNPFITKPILQWIVDASVLSYTREQGGDVVSSVDSLYTGIQSYNALRRAQPYDYAPLLTLFGEDSRQPTKEDLQTLFELIQALNWLDVRNLLLIVQDKVYEFVGDMTNEEITKNFTPKIRKKDSDYSVIKSDLPLTPYYKREKLISDYLGQSLPYDMVRSPTRVEKYINPIAAGRDHTLFLKADGLYVVGSNLNGQLGIPDEEMVGNDLTKITNIQGTPLLIAAGYEYSLCYTDVGLFGCGTNVAGELGLSDLSHRILVREWTQIPINGQLLLIEAHYRHTMVLTTTGLYACGFNDMGQLGLGDTINRRELTRVPGDLGTILRIVCGDSHTILLTSKGLYGCGHHIALPGISSTGNYLTLFTRLTVDTLNNIVSIDSGDNYTMLISGDTLYGKGATGRGQLGTGPSGIGVGFYGRVSSGEEVVIPGEIPSSVSCGYKSTFVLTKKGSLYATGNNAESQLGINDSSELTVDQFTKTVGLEEAGKILSISAADIRSFVYTETGVYQAGRELIFPDTARYRVVYYRSFTKIPVDMGYNTKTIIVIDADDDEGPARKKIRLDCKHCGGKARFISQKNESNLPFCSKYCLFKTQ